MRFTEKIDVLDLIIQILSEHEKKLDGITERLETVVNIVEDTPSPASPKSSKYLEKNK